MNEAASQVSLEEVRVRFLDSEARLSEAANAVGAIQEAAERLSTARDGLGAAGSRLGELAGAMDEVATSLAANATHLREGVDAIKAGDPAEIKRQIEELDAAFTAMQAVVGDRLDKLEHQGTTISTDVQGIAASLGTYGSQSRRDVLLVALVLGALLIVSIAVGFLR